MLLGFLELAALGERGAEMPVRLGSVGIERQRLAEFGDRGVELAARCVRDPVASRSKRCRRERTVWPRTPSMIRLPL